jgi:hypothetical protein
MDFGVYLPLIDFGGGRRTLTQLRAYGATGAGLG